MGLMCLFGKHTWMGCKCSSCGTVREEGHDWGKDCEKCIVCGKTKQEAHTWNGCKCSACGRTRDKEHDWSKNCEKCATCGKTEMTINGEHMIANGACIYCLCSEVAIKHFGWKCENRDGLVAAQNWAAHDWDGCKCIKCGRTRDEGHLFDGCNCKRCGKAVHNWNDIGACLVCGTSRPLPKARLRLSESEGSQMPADSFPDEMIGQALMGIINYEGTKDSALQRAVVDRLLPLMKAGGGFKTYCNATVPDLNPGQTNCAMIKLSETGISLDTYTAYLASKDSFPPGCPREFSEDRIGYWVGTQNGQKVHAILLFDSPTPKPPAVDKDVITMSSASDDLGMLLIYGSQEERDKAFGLISELHATHKWNRHLERRFSPNGDVVVNGQRRSYDGSHFIVMSEPSGDFWYSPEYKVMQENGCTQIADPLITYGEIVGFSVSG